MHFAHIAVLTIHLISTSIISFTDTLPQHNAYRYELNCECYNIRIKVDQLDDTCFIIYCSTCFRR